MMINKINQQIKECTDHIQLLKLNNELIKEHIIFEINKNLRTLRRGQLEKIYSNSIKIKPIL